MTFIADEYAAAVRRVAPTSDHSPQIRLLRNPVHLLYRCLMPMAGGCNV